MDGDIGIFRRSGWGKHGALAVEKPELGVQGGAP